MAPAVAHTVLIDGECVICNGFAIFVAERDDKGVFVFETQQSPAGQQLLDLHNLPNDLNTIVLIERTEKEETAYVKSSAVLRVMRRLRFPWYLLFGFILVPAVVRDYCYGVVGRNRYRWFGKKETCSLPDKALRAKLLRRLDE